MSLAEPGKPFDSLGEWWYVDTPEDRVRGRVSYVPAGTISLSLYCGREKLGSKYPDLLHGQCSGQEVTLMGVRYEGHSWAKGGTGETQFEAERLLIGEHFQRKDFTFSELAVRFDRLENWIGHSPFDWEAVTHDHRHVAASFVAPEPTEIEVSPDRLRILFDPELSPRISGQHFIVKYQYRVRILPSEPKSIFWFEAKLGTLASLLSLLADSAMHPVELLGQTGSWEEKAPFIIFSPGWDSRAGPARRVEAHHLLSLD